MTNDGYAVIPDNAEHPRAIFVHLEDAMEWGLETYGSDGFRIRRVSLADVDHGSTRPQAQRN